MKKFFRVLSGTMALGMSFLLAGCSEKAEETNVIRMGIMQGKSEIPIIIAKEKGFFEEEGLNVEITSFQGPNFRDAAVQAKEVDGVVTDIMTVLTYNQAGFPMTIASDMNEDFKLIAGANQDINTVKDFNGKNMIVVKNYLTHYVMDVIAKKEGITYEIETIPQIPLRLEAL
ncbi:MAG: ABC transporter substrate-binding protein, partial [Clostridium sp.]